MTGEGYAGRDAVSDAVSHGGRKAVSDAELLAAAYLSRVAEPASVALWILICELGYVAAAAAVRSGDVAADVAAATQARRLSADGEADLDAAARNGIRLLVPSSAQWPHFALAPLGNAAGRRAAQWQVGDRRRRERGELIPPLALWVRGNADLSQIGVRSLAVVGSRASTAYGDHIASEWAYRLSGEDVAIVSGGAYGIDAAAHRGAIAASGSSVLVSAGGLDRPYPAGNAQLYERITEHGLLVSERPPGSAPHRQRFLSRNRLIASFGSATLVVEAAYRSGALNSAGYARDLGRPLLAVPGPVSSAMSQGCHRLLRRDEDPARLVGSVEDVLEYFPQSAATPPGGPTSPIGPAAPIGPASLFDDLNRDGLTDSERRILDGFPARAPVTEAELSRLCAQPISAVVSALPVLADLGLITTSREGYRLAHRDRAAARRGELTVPPGAAS